MDQRRLHGSTIALEGSQEPRDHSLKQGLRQYFKFLTRPLSLDLKVKRLPYALGEELLPTVLPLDELRQVAGVRGDVEPNLPIGETLFWCSVERRAANLWGSGMSSIISRNSQRKK